MDKTEFVEQYVLNRIRSDRTISRVINLVDEAGKIWEKIHYPEPDHMDLLKESIEKEIGVIELEMDENDIDTQGYLRALYWVLEKIG